MPVDAINERITSRITNTTENGAEQTKPNYNNMTAKEIIDGYNNEGLAVPKDVLEWAQKTLETDPNSTVKYGDVAANSEGASPADVISYVQAMQEDGMSLRQICVDMTDLSKEMEERDLANVARMSAFMPDIPEGSDDSESDGSEVSKLMDELNTDMRKRGRGIFFIDKIEEDIKFFDALKQTDENEVVSIDESLEDIASVLNEADTNSKQSMEFGEMTATLGSILKRGRARSIKIPGLDILGGIIGGIFGLFSGKRRIANRAIEQGEKTLAMGEKTNKLANALAKDNNIALGVVEEAAEFIEQSDSSEIANAVSSTEPGSAAPSGAAVATSSGGESSSAA